VLPAKTKNIHTIKNLEYFLAQHFFNQYEMSPAKLFFMCRLTDKVGEAFSAQAGM